MQHFFKQSRAKNHRKLFLIIWYHLLFLCFPLRRTNSNSTFFYTIFLLSVHKNNYFFSEIFSDFNNNSQNTPNIPNTLLSLIVGGGVEQNAPGGKLLRFLKMMGGVFR